MESLIVAQKTFIIRETINSIVTFTQYFILILAIVNIIISIKKNKKKNIFLVLSMLVLSFACNLIGQIVSIPMDGVLVDGSAPSQLYSIILGYVLIIISIIIQFIPLILALRKKKNKEDEVKKENV